MALKGVRVLEMSGLAPIPYCGQVLRDFGASVIRVDRAGFPGLDRQTRGKQSIALNMKSKTGQNILHELVQKSDVILDPFRPGVMERMNAGPDELLRQNERLIFARLSGFGQSGPLRLAPGHDINYIAQAGVLDRLRDERGKPQPPVNLVADFAGGGLLLSTAIIAALFERTNSGKGQVLDLSMSEGAAYAAGFFWAMSAGLFPAEPGTNILDGGAHFYGTYETADKRWMAVGSIEPPFYADLIRGLNLEAEIDISDQMDMELWDENKKILAQKFREKTQAEWTEIFENTQACCNAVLTPEEAAGHPHNVDRNIFLSDENGTVFPAPVPKFSRTECEIPTKHSKVGGNSAEILENLLGKSKSEIENLVESGAVA